MVNGIDISYHNGVVNLKRARDEGGVKMVMIRAGYGAKSVDQKFNDNAQQAVNLGLTSGIYWFSYAGTINEARNEAKSAIECAKKYWKHTYICFDLEYDTVLRAAKRGITIGKKLATDMACAFLDEVSSQGYVPVLYTNKDYKQRMFDISVIQNTVPGTLIWYARYTSALPATEREGIWAWQHSSKGKVPGLSGNVDMNYFYFDGEITCVPEKDTNETNIYIQQFQRAVNMDELANLTESGYDDAATQKIRKSINLKAVPKYIRTTCSKYVSDPELTKKYFNVICWVQTRLKELGLYSKDIDGSFGPASRNATLEFQKKYNLKTDGIAGYNTLTALMWH